MTEPDTLDKDLLAVIDDCRILDNGMDSNMFVINKDLLMQQLIIFSVKRDHIIANRMRAILGE